MRRIITALASLLIAAPAALAQAPHLPHRTIRTEHFAVHFTPELEPLARRAAVHAERAYAQLSEELVPPRGTIDLVISDNVDYANGYATVFPTPRVVVYAHPPIETPSLRYNNDWLQLVITHELAHVFHLDRSRGMWRGLQYVFGRNPLLFPNSYSPSWVTEGLATWYESRLTGTGRVEGTYHRELASAAAREARLPRLDEVSGATPVFPGGQGVYVYGSLLFDHIARTRGPGKIPELIERTAVHPVPFILNRVSRTVLGTSYSDAWRELADSLDRTAGEYQPPLARWRDLTPRSFASEYLRWHPDGTITYTGAAPRERYGAYEIAPDGSRRYLGRRNGATPNVRLADGSLLYAQPDYVDPYTFRTDLYLARGGDVTRLTRGARLSAPDATPDGRIVAVQAVPGGSRLVLFDLATRAITPITRGGIDEYWAEPRWSPDGTLIVAIRWERGTSSVVVLDAAGAVVEEIASGQSVQSAPIWTHDSRAVVFASDVGGVSQLYRVELGAGGRPTLLSSGTGSLFWPALSPGGDSLAAARLGGGGYRVGTAPLDRDLALLQGSAAPNGQSLWTPSASAPDDSAVTAPATRYAPLRQLVPRFWLPAIEGHDDDTRLGFYTAGHDILQRHAYEAELTFPVEGHGVGAALAYSYAGLKQPVIGASVQQYFDLRGSVYADTTLRERIGHIDRRTRALTLSTTFQRPRVRSNLAFVLAGGAEWRANVVHPDLALDVDPGFFADSLIRRVTAGLAYSRVRSAPYAISPEDGFTFSIGSSIRWTDVEAARSSQSVTAITTGYKSLPLPGFARHVAAVRLAGGVTDARATDELQVGGVSGGTLPVAFGLASIGEGRRTFFVRGFEPATLVGTRAWSASAEYRAPLAMLARGAGLLPFFLDRTSVALFADAGSAWCPTFVPTLCYDGNPRTTIGAVGGEARISLAFGSWDAPFQVRAGIARPVLEPALARDRVTAYLTTGLSF